MLSSRNGLGLFFSLSRSLSYIQDTLLFLHSVFILFWDRCNERYGLDCIFLRWGES
jgi:hypothetical protein